MSIRVEFPLTQLSYSPTRRNGKEHSCLLTQDLHPQVQRCFRALLRWELHISQVFSFVSAVILFLVGGCGC